MSKRQTIVNVLIARLSAISDIKSVDDWKVHKLSEKEMPAIIVRDVGSKADSSAYGSIGYVLSIEVDVLVSDSSTTMETLRIIMSNVLTAVGAEGDDFIDHIAYDGDDILAEHQDHFYGGARMKFSVAYSTAAWEL